jgi:hypothetical protein
MPQDDDLVPANAKNPTGYWESMSLVAFNSRVLSAVGSDMRCPLLLPHGWELDPRLDELRREAAGAVSAAFPQAPWVWKDPRNSLSFAFWRATLAVEPVVVLAHRNPLEVVASSMRTRGEESKLYLLALWERYMREALDQIAGLRVLVTDYSALLSDPLVWSERMRAFLQRAGVETRSAPDEQVRGFVDPQLRHVRFSAAEFLEDGDVSDGQRALFHTLNSLVGEFEEFPEPALPPETPSTELLLAERREALHAPEESRLARLRRLALLRLAATE